MAPRSHTCPASTSADPGFEIGWDYAHHGLLPPAEQLLLGNPVRRGWQAGQDSFGNRTLRATPAVKKWLQLRLGAWMRGKTFDLSQVTPRHLEGLNVPVCPITGLMLTQGTGADTDASVDRVNNQAGYAAGNLAVMSVRANRAKSAYGWRDAAGFVGQIERGHLGQIDGLSARQWARLAALMSLCTPMGHEQAASLPLLVLPPAGLRVLNPAQALQAALTLAFAQPGRGPRPDTLVRLFPAALHPALRALFGVLLGARISAGPAASGQRLRKALEAAWCSQRLLKRWQALAVCLRPNRCESIATSLTSGAGKTMGMRCLSFEQATQGWALETGGLIAVQFQQHWAMPTGAEPNTAALPAPSQPATRARQAGARRAFQPRIPSSPWRQIASADA